MIRGRLCVLFSVLSLAASGCESTGRSGSDNWTGTLDTLPSGQVVVHNTAEAIWPEGGAWQVEDNRVNGTLELLPRTTAAPPYYPGFDVFITGFADKPAWVNFNVLAKEMVTDAAAGTGKARAVAPAARQPVRKSLLLMCRLLCYAIAHPVAPERVRDSTA